MPDNNKEQIALGDWSNIKPQGTLDKSGYTGAFSTAFGNTDFGESKYDKSDLASSYIKSGEYQEERAQEQGILSKWGNGITKAAGVAGTSILENTAGLVYGIGSAVSNTDPSKIYNNDFTKSLDDFNNWVAKEMPNYHTKAEQDYNLLQKIGTANFWSDQALNGAAYMGAAIATGIGLNEFASLGKLARAGKIIDETRLATEGAKYLNEISKGIKIADAVDFGKNAALMSHGESAQEARQTYNDTKAQLIKDFTDKYKKEPDAEAMDAIEANAKAAGNWGYATNLAITGTTNALLFPKLLSEGYGANKIKLNNIELLGGGKAIAEAEKVYTGMWKEGIKGALEEGGQELGQLLTQKTLTDYYSQGFKDKKDQHGMVESLTNGLTYTLGSEEGLENFFLGALMGAPAGAIQARGETAATNARTQQVADLINNNPKIKETVNSFSNFVRATNYEKQKNEALQSGSKFDYLNAEFNQNKSIAKQFIDRGATEQLIQQYEDLKGLSEEEFKKIAGYEADKPLPHPQSTIINDAISLVKSLDQTNNSIKELFPYNEKQHKSPENYNVLTTNLWHYSTSLDNINKRVKEIHNDLYKIAADKSVVLTGNGTEESPFSVEGNPMVAQQVNQANEDLYLAKAYKDKLIESYKLLADKLTQKKTLEKIINTANEESTKPEEPVVTEPVDETETPKQNLDTTTKQNSSTTTNNVQLNKEPELEEPDETEIKRPEINNELYPNTRTIKDGLPTNNLERDKIAEETKGLLLSSKEVQNLIDKSVRESKNINDEITIDAIDYKGNKSVRVKIGDRVLGYFQTKEQFNSDELNQLMSSIKIGDKLTNNQLKELGFNLNISNGFIASSNNPLTVGELKSDVIKTNNGYLVFDQGSVTARSKGFDSELITDSKILNNSEDGVMPPMDLGRYVLKFYDKSGNQHFVPLKTSNLNEEELNNYLDELRNLSNKVIDGKLSQSEIDELNNKLNNKVFIALNKEDLGGKRLETSLDVDPKGNLRISFYQYKDSHLNNEPFKVIRIANNEINNDNNGLIEDINNLTKPSIGITISKDSFRNSIPKKTTLTNKQVETLFKAFTKHEVLEGQDVVISFNKPVVDLKTVSTEGIETKTEEKPVQLNKEDDELDDLFNDDVIDTEIKPPVFKISDKEADKFIDSNEISEVKKIVPEGISVETRNDLRNTIKNVTESGTLWGAFMNKVIYLSNKAGAGTGFHEAFHAIFRMAISDKEVDRYLKLAEKEILTKLSTKDKLDNALNKLKASNTDYQDLTPKELYHLLLEEHMSDGYSDYTTSDKSVRTSTGLKQLFRRISNVIKNLLGIGDKLEAFYDKIDRGAFASTKAVGNKLTFVTDRVFKNLISGENSFMSSSKSKKMINTFAARIKQKSKEPGFTSNDEVLEELIQERLANLKNDAIPYIKSITNDDSKKEKLTQALKEEIFTLRNLSAKALLIEQVNKRLDLFNISKIYDKEDEDDQNNDVIADENSGEIGGSKEAWTISLEEGTNKVIREYIAFATYTTIDELTNKPVILSVDNQTIYNGLAHTLANTPEDKMMNKFIYYAKNNEQAKAVLDMIMSDTGMTYDDNGLISSPKKNFNDLRKIITAFKNVKIEFLHTEFSPVYEGGVLDSNQTRVYNANSNTAEKISMSKWANSLFNINKLQSDENKKTLWTNKINTLTKAFNNGNVKEIQAAFKDIGISLSTGYIEYSVYANKPSNELTQEETNYLNTWNDINVINIKDFNSGEFSFKNILIDGKNPYDTGKEGMSSKLAKIAESNGMFDETIQASNFTGADGNVRYDIIKSSYVLDETLRLRNSNYREQLVKKYPILKDNFLLNNIKLLKDLKVSLIDGVRNHSTDDEGKVYGDYSEREYLFQHIGFWFAQKNNRVETLFRQNEASNTAYTANLETDEYISSDGKLNDKAIDRVYSFFKSEFDRISDAKEGNIKGYNDKPTGRAFRFTEFSGLLNILGPAKYNEITNLALAKQELSDDLIKDVKNAISTKLSNEIKEFKNILNSNGFANFEKGEIVSNNILPTHINNTKLTNKQITKQIEELYINNYINSFALNQLFDGDYAMSREDKGGITKSIDGIDVIVPKQDLSIDIVKRNKGAMGSGSDLGNGEHRVSFIKDINVFVDGKKDGQLIRSDKGEKINSNDAQSYTNINHIIFMAERLGRVSEDVKSILRKIRRGINITSKEQLTLEAAQASLNPWKTVTFGREFYIKTSEALISRHEVSFITDMKAYNELMDKLEHIENTREVTKESIMAINEDLVKLYQPIPGKEYYHKMLNQMDIHGIDQIVAESASKGMTLDPQDSLDDNLDLSKSMTDIPNSYKRLQVETPTGKNVITAGTQLMQLIDSEQNDSTIVDLNGVKTSIGAIREQYRTAMGNTRDNSFKLAEAYLKDGTNNANLKKKFIRALELSGADEQLLEIFNLNWNLLPAIDKAEQLFLAHFGSGILAQKVPGTKVSLMSDAHFNLVVDENNKPILNKTVKENPSKYTSNKTRKLLHNVRDIKTGQLYSECVLSEKVFSKFELSIGDEIPVDVANMLGYRIPTQDKHSMISLRVVDVLPNYLEGTGIFPSEIVLLSGADFDIDSLFIQQPSFFMNGGLPIKAGNEKTREQRWAGFLDYFHKNKLLDGEYQDRLNNSLEYKELAKIKKKDRKGEETIKLNAIRDEIRRNVLQYFNLPINESEYNKAFKEGKQLNNNILNNQILDDQLALLTNKAIEDIALTPVTSDPMKDVADDITKLKGEENKQSYSSSSLLGMFNSNSQNSAGKAGIGPVANALQAFTFLAKNNINRGDLLEGEGEGENKLIINNVGLRMFKYLNEDGHRIADTLSTILSVMTDNAKDPIAGKMGLSLEILTPFNYLISLGVSLKDAALIINTPSIQMYAKMLKESKYSLKSNEEQFKSKKDKLDELFNELLGHDKNAKINVEDIKSKYNSDNIDTKALEEVIKEGMNDSNRNINISTLVKFIQITEEAKAFQDLNNLIKLTKGLPTSFLDVNKGMYESLYNLGLNKLFNLPAREKQTIPIFDISDTVKNDKLLYSNINNALSIIKHSEQLFITETKQVKGELEKLISNLKPGLSKDKIKDLKRNLLGFITTNAYVKLKQQESAGYSPTDDSLLFPELEGNTLAMDLIKLQNSSNDRIKNNQLIKWLKPELKFSEEGELIDKYAVFDKVSGKSFIKLSQESINDLVNSFRDLWNDEETHQFSIDLFHYLLTKDNLEYKNDSFIKYIAPFMFNSVSRGLDAELKGLTDGMLTNELREQSNEFRKILAAYKPTQESYIQKINADLIGFDVNKQKVINFTINSNRSMFDTKTITEGDIKTRLFKFPEFITIKTSKGVKLFYNNLEGKIEDWNEQANYVELKSAGYKAVSPFSKASYEDFIRTYDAIEAAKYKRKAKLEAKEQEIIIPDAIEAKNIDDNKIPTELKELERNINNNLDNSNKSSILDNMNITFEEEQTSGYKNRTIKNASADVTIAIASDFNTAGEKLTKNSVLNQNKLYLPVSTDIFSSSNDVNMMAGRIVGEIRKLNKKEITLNVAGNGIYSLKEVFPGGQNSVDIFTLELFKNIINRLNEENIKISLLRTGGQTGFDEAGAKAGVKLNIPTTILAPKGWVFRDINSKDISNEQQFKNRFSKEIIEIKGKPSIDLTEENNC